MADNNPKTIILTSSDGEEFELPEAVALKYCRKHTTRTEKATKTPTKVEKAQKAEERRTETPKAISPEEELKQWDAKFVDVDKETLFGLVLAANYLGIRGLLDLTTEKLANMMKGMTPGEIRKFFNERNGYTLHA